MVPPGKAPFPPLTMRLDLTNVASIPQTQNYLKIPAYFVAFFAIWKLFGLLLHRYLVGKKTVVYDIPNLAVPRPESKRLDGTAVICGGG